MYKIELEFEDFNGEQKKETHRFNITKMEVLKWNMQNDEKLVNKLERLAEEKNGEKLFAMLDDLVARAYGIKTDDGLFDKSPEHVKKFKASGAYDTLMLKLMTETEVVTEFVTSIFPKM